MRTSIILHAIVAGSSWASPISDREDKNLAVTTSRRDSIQPTVNQLSTPQIAQQRQDLLLAQSETAREAILFPSPPNAQNDTFQFINNTVLAPTGGIIRLATINNFPALGSTGLGQAVGFVSPCGLNTPHWHPRANEFLTVVQGTLVGALILENDVGFGNVVGQDAPATGPLPQIKSLLTNYTGMLFPKGLVHWQFNPECEPAVFVAGFDTPDPGRAEIARNFFTAEPDEVIESSLYYSEFLSPDQILGLQSQLTSDFTSIVKSCAQKCGIPFTTPGLPGVVNEDDEAHVILSKQGL